MDLCGDIEVEPMSGQSFGRRRAAIVALFLFLGVVQLAECAPENRSTANATHITSRVYMFLGNLGLNGCPSPDELDDLRRAFTVPVATNGAEQVDLFSLPGVVRILYRAKQCGESKSLREFIDAVASLRHEIYTHGTINHAIIRSTSWLLLSQLMNDDKEIPLTNGAKTTAKKVREILGRQIKQRLEGDLDHLHAEFTSSTYALLNFVPLLNLYDYSGDPDLRRLADRALNLQYGVVRVNSFDGVLLPPITRRNTDQRRSSGRFKKYTPAASQQILYIYSNQPPNLTDFDLNGGGIPQFYKMMEASSWRPDRRFNELAGDIQNDGYSTFLKIPSFVEWGEKSRMYMAGGSDVARSYAVSYANAAFQPNGYSSHMQAMSVAHKVDGEFNQIECVQPYFDRSKVPSFGPGQWSPFLQAYRPEFGVVLLIGDIPEFDPYEEPEGGNKFAKDRLMHGHGIPGEVYCRIPKDGFEVRHENGRIDVKSKRARTILTALQGDFEEIADTLTHSIFVLRARHICLQISTGPLNESLSKYKYWSEGGRIFWMEKGARRRLEFGGLKPLGDGWVGSFPRVNGVDLMQSLESKPSFDSDIFSLRAGRIEFNLKSRSYE